MPKPLIKKIAKEKHHTVKKVENDWHKAKKLAEKENYTKDSKYAVATSILEKMEHYK